MAATLPVPIEFSLPDGWLAPPPDEVGATGVAFVAIEPESRDGFTANITISGELREDTANLEWIADESVQRLGKIGRVQIIKRTQVGSGLAPALTQNLRLATQLHGRPIDLVQSQVFLVMRDTSEPLKRAVIELAL